MDGRHPAGRGQSRRLQLEPFHPLRVVRRLDPRDGTTVRLLGEAAGGTPVLVELDPVRVGQVDRGEGRGAHDRDVAVRSRGDDGGGGDRVEVGGGRELAGVPSGFVEPLDVHDGDLVGHAPADQGQELLLRPGLPDVGVRERAAVAVRWTWLSMNPGTIVVPGRSIVSSASGGSPVPTRWTCRSSTRIHSPIVGWDSVTTREAR